jgi:hypothetical protein
MNVQDLLINGLALSGGGFRASLFSLGSLWRLNEMGWLRKLDIITSVSGGSITNAVLASRWSKLTWSEDTDGGIATNFEDLVAAPLQDFCSQNLDVAAGLQGLLSPFESIADRVEEAYNDKLFHNATTALHFLRDKPAIRIKRAHQPKISCRLQGRLAADAEASVGQGGRRFQRFSADACPREVRTGPKRMGARGWGVPLRSHPNA